MASFVVELTRPNKSVTWGFSIQGGKDFGCPLSVLRVTPNSLSHQRSIQVEDLILKINDIPTDTLTHQQAILQIQNLNVKLELSRNSKKDSELPLPPPVDLSNFNSNCRISTSIIDLPPPPPELSNFSSTKPKEIHYPPPPPPIMKQDYLPAKGYEPVKPNQEYYDLSDITKIAGKNSESKNDNNSSFKQQMNDTKNKESQPMGLGHFLKNQEPMRDNRDLIIHRPNTDKDLAICFVCKDHIKGSYIEANNKVYCSNHFCCSYCNIPIKGTQFIETKEGILYCMDDFTNNIAARCSRCCEPIIEQQIMALGKCWHPNCFLCNHCKKPIPQGQFHIKEENNDMIIYCEKDYKAYYELKCFACKLAIDSDDKYLQVSNNNYHVECYKVK